MWVLILEPKIFLRGVKIIYAQTWWLRPPPPHVRSWFLFGIHCISRQYVIIWLSMEKHSKLVLEFASCNLSVYCHIISFVCILSEASYLTLKPSILKAQVPCFETWRFCHSRAVQPLLPGRYYRTVVQPTYTGRYDHRQWISKEWMG